MFSSAFRDVASLQELGRSFLHLRRHRRWLLIYTALPCWNKISQLRTSVKDSARTPEFEDLRSQGSLEQQIWGRNWTVTAHPMGPEDLCSLFAVQAVLTTHSPVPLWRWLQFCRNKEVKFKQDTFLPKSWRLQHPFHKWHWHNLTCRHIHWLSATAWPLLALAAMQQRILALVDSWTTQETKWLSDDWCHSAMGFCSPRKPWLERWLARETLQHPSRMGRWALVQSQTWLQNKKTPSLQSNLQSNMVASQLLEIIGQKKEAWSELISCAKWPILNFNALALAPRAPITGKTRGERLKSDSVGKCPPTLSNPALGTRSDIRPEQASWMKKNLRVRRPLISIAYCHSSWIASNALDHAPACCNSEYLQVFSEPGCWKGGQIQIRRPTDAVFGLFRLLRCPCFSPGFAAMLIFGTKTLGLRLEIQATAECSGFSNIISLLFESSPQ